jgi:hypothetical protein
MRGAVCVALAYAQFDVGGSGSSTDRHRATLIVSTLVSCLACRWRPGWRPGWRRPDCAHASIVLLAANPPLPGPL